MADQHAMDVDVCEATRVIRLLRDVKVDGVQPATLHCDNQSTILVAKNPFSWQTLSFHKR